MENENGVASPNEPKDVTPEVTADETAETTETVEEVKARLAKAEELATNYKIRAEKAEKAAKGTKTEVPEAKNDNLSSKDIYALMDAKVPEDDIDEVTGYAKFKGISIKDALKSSTVKAILAEKSEQRRTADATNTGTSRRGTGKLTGEALMENASKGKLPEDPTEISRLLEAKMKESKK